MIIHNVSNFSRFFQTVDQCGDDVTLIMPDGSAYHWQEQRLFVLSLLEALDTKKYNKMELLFRDTQDVSHVLCTLLECEMT